ncbi:hypothetical protein R5W23_006071 [Gemmata sp. JC673]|uniref:DNA topoisomerase (ATP-hydrolyzing) n=1 Tax=Gemmata algarum TaxID=2975278 RepID=A0ABU5EUM4_9BACT|nr:hypothetical protein [Gemmata algarum]MDY3558895.1 hypothetical protein [Gemmata algarum]
MKCGYNTSDPIEANLPVEAPTEAIRLRPGMFLGGTGSRGLHHLLFELVNDALGPLSGDPAGVVRVALDADGFVEISDDCSPPLNVEAVFSRMSGLHAADSRPVACALSEELTARARRSGAVTQCTFRRGQLHAETQFGGPPDDCGLTVRFRPDPAIFGAARFDPDIIRNRLQQCAFLNSGVRIAFADESSGTEDVFEYADGIADYVKWLNTNRTPVHAEVVAFDGEANGVRYEVGLQWCDEGELSVSFANGYQTLRGGTHEYGARAGVRDAVDAILRANLPNEKKVTTDDVRGGLTTVVSVGMNAPQFSGATRDQLANPDVERALRSEVQRALSDFLEEHIAVADVIVRRVLAKRDVREGHKAARKQK